ncbi:chloride channel protein [Microvirga terricola]|uniref:Chloride channel protein n=1 Tax=Microvirga terricola TaxID=2719797 RepID=A0ABX0VB61_9HYPH|nr:chloride channel protein [Microvirga terricola]NIX77093.1 chloride channel protein [Microvirga terricola]
MSPERRISPVPPIRKPTGSFRLVAFSTGLGVAAGLIVAAVQGFVIVAQRATLGFAAEHRIALPEQASYLRIALALTAGAILVTILSRASRLKKREPIDAVEANALHGGSIGWYDALAVVLPIMASVSFGASVGIEAAVTQLGAVLASRLGKKIGRPRSDVRVLVGAGAAAAIAAAYRAPIAGMLYAFELILGTYSKRTLAPVGLAAIAAVITVWLLTGQAKPFNLILETAVSWSDYPLAVLIGAISAFMGIGVMLLVTTFERFLKRLFKYETLRRITAALVLTLLSVRFPAVLGSGHAAIDHAVNGDIVGPHALGLLGAKALASPASLGGGFKGGLFSASLLMGALLGQVLSWIGGAISGSPPMEPALCAVVGMASVGASVIGCPLTMIFLVLETTGDFDAAIVVAIGAVTASFLTDRLFGYSFATWRFQQRGLAIEGGHDVSRLAASPITPLIKAPKRSLATNAALDEVLRAVSTAGGRGTAVYSLGGAFVGLIDPRLVEIASAEREHLPIVAADLIYETGPAVTPGTTLEELLEIFQHDDRPTVAVIDPANNLNLVGCVRARDAFASASAILDAQRRDDLGLSL